MSKSFKSKWKCGSCKNSERNPGGQRRAWGRGAIEADGGRREGDRTQVQEGFGNYMKQPFACCCDQVGLQISFLILHLRTATYQERLNGFKINDYILTRPLCLLWAAPESNLGTKISLFER